MASIPNTLFVEWMAYYEIEPFGEERADLRNAIVACLIANSNLREGQTPFKVEDFMPNFEKSELSKEEAVAALEAMFDSMVTQ